jgi:hypothetical protein
MSVYPTYANKEVGGGVGDCGLGCGGTELEGLGKEGPHQSITHKDHPKEQYPQQHTHLQTLDTHKYHPKEQLYPQQHTHLHTLDTTHYS